MGLFGRKSSLTKCKEYGTELNDSERLKKHVEKAHKKILEKCRSCGAGFHTSEAIAETQEKM